MKRRLRIFVKTFIIIALLGFPISWVSVSIFGFETPFGTPYGWLISKYKIESYSKAVYGENIETGRLSYNFKDGTYICQLTSKDNIYFNTVAYNTSKDIIIDQFYIGKIDGNSELKDEIKAIDSMLGKDIHLPPPMTFHAIDGNQDFSNKPLKSKDKIYLLAIKNTDVTLSPEQSKEKMLDIISFIFANLGDKYNFTSSQIMYIDINGVKQIDISANESILPYKEIEYKIEEEQRGVLDEEFINQLKAVRSDEISKEEIILNPSPH